MPTAFEALSNAFDNNVGGFKTSLPGQNVALLPSTVIVASGTVANAAALVLEHYNNATILLTITGKVMDASTTLDIYLQYSPDGGTSWDDLAHYAQITSAAIPNGKYITLLTRELAAGAVDRALTDGTLAVNSIRNISWCDRIRVKTVAVNFSGSDTITIKVDGFFQR